MSNAPLKWAAIGAKAVGEYRRTCRAAFARYADACDVAWARLDAERDLAREELRQRIGELADAVDVPGDEE